MAWLAENWVLLIFGVGMVAMHLFGHGHGAHGKDKQQDNNTAGIQASRPEEHSDPVCGKVVDPQQGYGMMYQRQLLRFCSRDCLDRFEAEPAAYLEPHKRSPPAL